MTRPTRTLFLLLALVLGVIGWAGNATAAYAGGPTSVLMTNPGSGRASALYTGDADYDRLYAAVGEATGDLEPPSGLSPDGGEVRLTWLRHDVWVWRIDRVHLTRHDGIWLETVTEQMGEGHPLDQPSRWHRAEDEQGLTALLTEAGLLGTGSAPSSPPTGNDPSPVTAAGSVPPQPVVPIVAAALGGLVIGGVGSLLLRRRPTADQPRVTLSG